jgi:hypothetical protein
MRPEVHSYQIIYLLFSFEGKDYTVRADFEELANTELYLINVDVPELKKIVGDFFLIWRLANGQFKYNKNNKPGSDLIKEAVVNSISRLID